MVEGARLESVYTVTPYRGFESLSPPTLLELAAVIAARLPDSEQKVVPELLQFVDNWILFGLRRRFK